MGKTPQNYGQTSSERSAKFRGSGKSEVAKSQSKHVSSRHSSLQVALEPQTHLPQTVSSRSKELTLEPIPDTEAEGRDPTQSGLPQSQSVPVERADKDSIHIRD